MAETIRDGTGGGYVAKVDSSNRLHTNAVTLNEQEEALKIGDAYNINTGIITLTNDSDTPILYVKNNNGSAMHIKTIAVGVGATTGGSGINTITVIRNPTAGTIISGATNVDINSNRNYASSNTLSDVLAYKGATGNTMTDGDDHIIFFQGNNGRLFAGIEEYIPKGTSMGIKFNPGSGNTSVDVYCALILHVEPSE